MTTILFINVISLHCRT